MLTSGLYNRVGVLLAVLRLALPSTARYGHSFDRLPRNVTTRLEVHTMELFRNRFWALDLMPKSGDVHENINNSATLKNVDDLDKYFFEKQSPF